MEEIVVLCTLCVWWMYIIFLYYYRSQFNKPDRRTQKEHPKKKVIILTVPINIIIALKYKVPKRTKKKAKKSWMMKIRRWKHIQTLWCCYLSSLICCCRLSFCKRTLFVFVLFYSWYLLPRSNSVYRRLTSSRIVREKSSQ